MTPSAKRTGDLRALTLVLALLLCTEALLRLYGGVLSGDVEHLREVDEITAGVAGAPGASVLLWGNSLIAAGIDPAPLESALAQRLTAPPALGMVRPDGTGPLEWRYLFRKTVLNRQLDIDVLVLGFGPGHLIDRPAAQSLDRLAAHHVAWRDIPTLFREDVTSIEERASFMLSRISATHSLRERIRDRVLDAAIPGYRELARTLLSTPSRTSGVEGEGPPPGRTYRHLERLLADASSAGVEVIGLPMPAPRDWAPEPEEMSAFGRVEGRLLDVRVQAALEADRFPDGEHLDESGREWFSNVLAPVFVGTVAELLR